MTLGDIDGEHPALATVRVTGTGWADRAMLHGERVAVTVIGEVTSVAFQVRDGALIRMHTIRAESMAEATGALGERIDRFLRDTDDAREGRRRLPLDEETEEET